MISENFPSHFNPQPHPQLLDKPSPQPPPKTPPTINQTTSQPPIPPEPVKPAITAQSTPTPAKTRKQLN